jgi:hypothetical protein
VRCDVPDQDLSVVWGLVLLLVGIIVGRLSHKIKTEDD